jgi:hypothetical protein
MGTQRNYHTIDDGYDEPGFIAEVPRLFPALRFTYRPMLPEQRDFVLRQLNKLTPEQYSLRVCAEIAARVKSWNATGRAGAVVPINVASVRTLWGPLFDRLFAVISGDMASDVDPEASPEDQQRAADDAMQAGLQGLPPGIVEELKSLGNSK